MRRSRLVQVWRTQNSLSCSGPYSHLPEEPATVDPGLLSLRLRIRYTLRRRRLQDRAGAPGACTVVELSAEDVTEEIRHAWAEEVIAPTLHDDDRDPLPGHGLRRLEAGWLVLADDADAGRRETWTAQVADAAWRGHPVVILTHDAEGLPPALLQRAEHVRLAPLTMRQLRSVIHRRTGGRLRTPLPRDLPKAVTPQALRLTCRRRQTARQLATALIALSAISSTSKARPGSGVSGGKTLDQLHLPADVLAWARAFVRDLIAYREGRLRWEDLERGALLYGPPGAGKTSLIRAIAAEAGVTLIATSYGDWLGRGEGHLGDVTQAIDAIFREALAAGGLVVVLIDEMDALSSRDQRSPHGQWYGAIVGHLLIKLDGAQGREGVVVIGASNRPDEIDPALLRAGRLDRRIEVGLPDQAAMLRILADQVGGDLPGVDVAPVALALLGRSGADADAVIRAARRRARHAERPLRLEDLLAEVGPREAPTAVEAVRRAAHEAGHVLVAEILLPGSVQGASLQPGRPWAPALERLTDLDALLQLLLSGRAGEEVLLGTVSAAAGGDRQSDLALATTLALDAVAAYGVGPSLAWLGEINPSRAGDLLMHRPDLRQLVNDRLVAAHGAVVARLRQHARALGMLSDALLPGRVLAGDELRSVMREAGMQEALPAHVANPRLH